LIDIIFVVLFALSFGSFLNVLIVRVPENINIAFPLSHCPKCKEKLKIWHNIPLISYFLLRGKCHFCGEKISFFYPLVEFLTAVIFLTVFWKFDFTISIDYVLISIIFSLLLTLSMIDFRYKAIPDSISLTTLLVSFFLFDIFDTASNILLFAGGFTLLRFYVSFILKKEAMGEGDIIIAGIMGAVLGIKLGLFAIFLSSFLALPISLFYRFSKNELELPFVPFLALATFLVFIFDDLSLNFLRIVLNG